MDLLSDERELLVDPPPSHKLATPCLACGGIFWWLDIAGQTHCCECVPIPARRMLASLWMSPTTGWEPWEPVGWEPFGHLPDPDAAEKNVVDTF